MGREERGRFLEKPFHPLVAEPGGPVGPLPPPSVVENEFADGPPDRVRFSFESKVDVPEFAETREPPPEVPPGVAGEVSKELVPVPRERQADIWDPLGEGTVARRAQKFGRERPRFGGRGQVSKVPLRRPPFREALEDRTYDGRPRRCRGDFAVEDVPGVAHVVPDEFQGGHGKRAERIGGEHERPDTREFTLPPRNDEPTRRFRSQTSRPRGKVLRVKERRWFRPLAEPTPLVGALPQRFIQPELFDSDPGGASFHYCDR